MTTTFRGLPACTCQVAWFPVFERELRARGIIKQSLTLAQLIGAAEASAGTHSGGGAADWWETDIRIAQVARELGAPATWPRTTGSFATNKHTHSVLRGCPHLDPGAAAQIAEVDRGGDGLVGAISDHPELKRFTNKRTWQQGIRHANKLQLQRDRLITIGTHNTLDGKADESGFADVIVFTEAVPREVRRELEKTHKVWACQQQKDLVLAVAKRLNPKMLDQEYKLSNFGIPKVTPKRGTWMPRLELLGVVTSIVIDHRINAAFAPWIRGEKIIRQRFWKRHTRKTKALIRKAKGRGDVVVYGGDPNTPKQISAVGNTLNWEVGDGKDRLASNRQITNVKVLSKDGSDHHRLRGTIQL